MDKMNAAESYMVPEILGLRRRTFGGILQEERRLEKIPAFFRWEIFRQKPHTLDMSGRRKFLAKAGELAKSVLQCIYYV